MAPEKAEYLANGPKFSTAYVTTIFFPGFRSKFQMNEAKDYLMKRCTDDAGSARDENNPVPELDAQQRQRLQMYMLRCNYTRTSQVFQR